MTSLIELRKQQQLIVTSTTPSAGYLAGEAVTSGTLVPNPGVVYPNGSPTWEGLLVMDGGVSILGVSLDEGLTSTDMTSEENFYGATFTPAPAEGTIFWHREEIVAGSSTTFRARNNNRRRVTLNIAQRPDVTVKTTTTVVSPTEVSRTIVDEPTLPRWTDVGSYSEVSSLARVIARYPNAQQRTTAALAFNDKAVAEAFGTDVDTYGWAFDTRSNIRNERMPFTWSDPDYGNRPVLARQVGNSLNLILIGVVNQNRYRAQISGWQPGRETTITETVTTATPSTTTRQVPPDTLVVVAQFWIEIPLPGNRQRIVQLPDQTAILPNAPGRVTFDFTAMPRDVEGRLPTAAAFTIKRQGGGVTEISRREWFETVLVPRARTFTDRSRRVWHVRAPVDPDGENVVSRINFYAHAPAIRIPTTATVVGTRPDERLQYRPLSEGPWDGTFKFGRCRCPAIILLNILQNERFFPNAVRSSRIDFQSFERASRYCQERAGTFARWSYDGILQGTQESIVRDLLSCMRGTLITTREGKIGLSLLQSNQIDWIICPANVEGGRITYRDALPRLPVRATFRNRYTGERQVTPGPRESRYVDVPFQDRRVAERWAAWETLNDQHLLGSVEFTMGWKAHQIQVGDTLGVFDPDVAGVRSAGLIVSDTATWMQVDRLPLELWPEQVASAQLLHSDPTAPVDPETWGWVYVDLPPGFLRVIREKGGDGNDLIPMRRIAWLPGGRDDQNRIYYEVPHVGVEPGTPWAIFRQDFRSTLWRVQSVSETGNGTRFRVAGTLQISGMFEYIDRSLTFNVLTPIPFPRHDHRWRPGCGTSLSQFRGPFTELNQRYPKEGTAPFGDPGTFEDLVSSCPR